MVRLYYCILLLESGAVFAPLFFLSGIIGKYIAGIPYTLVFVLIGELLSSYLTVATGFPA